MEVLQTYTVHGDGGAVAAYGALIRTEDGQVLDLTSPEPLSDAEWLAKAAALLTPEPVDSDVEVICENGTIV